jgi:DNA-binding MarR family transcriptional regulator
VAAEQRVVFRVGQIVGRLARHEEVVLAQIDLSPAQYRILSLLAGGPSNAAGLADKLAVTPPSLTTVVDGLVARGLVERSHDPDDRRRVAHNLTDEGSRVLEQADRVIEERLREILSHVSSAYAQRALRGLQAWQEPLDKYRAARLTSK